MRLIISAEGVKRELKGPFDLCASKRDLVALRDQIDNAISDETKPWVYGWMTIWPAVAPGTPNTEPMPWTNEVSK